MRMKEFLPEIERRARKKLTMKADDEENDEQDPHRRQQRKKTNGEGKYPATNDKDDGRRQRISNEAQIGRTEPIAQREKGLEVNEGFSFLIFLIWTKMEYHKTYDDKLVTKFGSPPKHHNLEGTKIRAEEGKGGQILVPLPFKILNQTREGSFILLFLPLPSNQTDPKIFRVPNFKTPIQTHAHAHPIRIWFEIRKIQSERISKNIKSNGRRIMADFSGRTPWQICQEEMVPMLLQIQKR